MIRMKGYGAERHAFADEKLLFLLEKSDGTLTATKAELARRCDVSTATIDRAMHKLRQKKLVRSKALMRDDGGQMPNTYTLTARGVKAVRRLHEQVALDDSTEKGGRS